jgi:hypothetical protein
MKENEKIILFEAAEKRIPNKADSELRQRLFLAYMTGRKPNMRLSTFYDLFHDFEKWYDNKNLK